MPEVISKEGRPDYIICPCGTQCIRGGGYFKGEFGCPECGRYFDSNGRELAPISQWGEETGEVFP